MKYEIGDAVMASLCQDGIVETIKTIVIDSSNGDVLVAWDKGDSGCDSNGWWVSASKAPDEPIETNSAWGKILGKICPNTLPKCLREKFKDVLKS